MSNDPYFANDPYTVSTKPTKMASYKHNTPTDAPRNEILTGDYPFEVVGFDCGLCPFGKEEKSSEMVELKLKFFADKTFSKPLAEWTERIVLHSKWEWKLHQFNAAANVQVDGRPIQVGDEFDYNEHSCVGLRGWAKCEPENDKDKTKIDDRTGQVKRYNRVAVFITNKEKLAKRVDVGEPTPAGDDVPF